MTKLPWLPTRSDGNADGVDGEDKEFAVRDLLRAMLARPHETTWESWLVVFTGAVADQDAWMRTIGALAVDDQFQLLEMLKQTGGIYADALLTMTARRAHDLDDLQLREFAFADAGEAAARLGDRLNQQRDVLESLLARAVAQHNSAFDAARETARLEARLNELNAANVGSEFEQAWHTESQITRLEALALSLSSYDAEARRAVRDELKAEAERLAGIRDDLEGEVSAVTRTRDQAAQDRTSLMSEVARLTQSRDELESALDNLGTQKADLTAQLADLQREHTIRLDEVTALQNSIGERRRLVEVESRRLEELRTSPGAQSDDRLIAMVHEIYLLLPADGAEADFADRATRGGT